MFSEKDRDALFREKKLPDIDAIEEKLQNLVTHTSALSKLLEDSHTVTNQFTEYAKFDGEVGFTSNMSDSIQFLKLQIIVTLYCRLAHIFLKVFGYLNSIFYDVL